MIRPRPLLLLVAGAGTLLVGGLPARAAPAAPVVAASASAQEALGLLDVAARAARSRTWSGTQFLATWRDGSASSQVVRVRHDASTGIAVSTSAVTGGTAVVPSADMDEDLLAHLADTFALSVTGSGTCSGRRARVVEARRPDGRVAGRFWLDAETGLALRREVWDAQGRQLRSSSYVDLQLADGAGAPGQGVPAGVPAVMPAVVPAVVPTAAEVALLDLPDSSGWTAPTELPGGYALFAVARPVHDGTAVLHLAYSDGLSTLSVFSQPGSLGEPGKGWTAQPLDRSTMWLLPGSPERVVWSGGGHVFTLVSDAGHDDLLAAVGVLPRDDAVDSGPLARLSRGLSRVASWIAPAR